jgi:hypothetical protein
MIKRNMRRAEETYVEGMEKIWEKSGKEIKV